MDSPWTTDHWALARFSWGEIFSPGPSYSGSPHSAQTASPSSALCDYTWTWCPALSWSTRHSASSFEASGHDLRASTCSAAGCWAPGISARWASTLASADRHSRCQCPGHRRRASETPDTAHSPIVSWSSSPSVSSSGPQWDCTLSSSFSSLAC